MAVSVLSAAKRLGEISGWSLSNLELQKLLYLAHMFYLGRTNGAPLVNGLFQAWDYGPVHPDLYHKVKMFGSDPVGNVFHAYFNPPDGAERRIIDEAYEKLRRIGPGQLVSATHRPGGAWHQYYMPGVRNRVIPNEAILKEYRELNAGR